MDLVGTVRQPKRADAGIGARQPNIVRNASRPKGLDCIVNDPQGHERRRDLDHRDLALRGLVAGAVHHVRCLEAEQPRHLDVDPRVGDALFPHALLCDGLAEGRAGHEPPGHRLQRFLGRADGPHAMVDTAWT